MKIKFRHIVFCLLVSIMTIQVNFNPLSLIDKNLFVTFQYDAESLIAGRLYRNDVDGNDSYSRFLGWNHPDPSILPDKTTIKDNRFFGWDYEVPGYPDKYKYQFTAYEDQLKLGHYEPYLSQNGIQALIYRIVGKILNIRGYELLNLCKYLNAMFFSAIVCGILYFLFLEFGWLSVIFSFTFLFASKWFVVFGNNLFYVSSLFYLPMLSGFLYLCFLFNTQ